MKQLIIILSAYRFKLTGYLCAIISLLTFSACSEAGLSDITKDLIDLFVASEDPKNLEDAVVLESTFNRRGKILYMTLLSTNLINSYSENPFLGEWQSFSEHNGRKIFTYGRSGFWWKGRKKQVDILEQLNPEVNGDWSMWKIVLHPDNTLNKYLTSKGRFLDEENVSDIETVFSKHSLLKNDSLWAHEHVFSHGKEPFSDQPVFIEPQKVVKYIWKHAVLDKDSDIGTIYLEVMIDYDGTLKYKDIKYYNRQNDHLTSEQKRKCIELGKSICSEFKAAPIDYRGARIRYICEFPIWPPKEVRVLLYPDYF